MNRLSKTVIIIEAKFTWADWDLYDMPDSARVATILNQTLEELVNDGYDRTDVSRHMMSKMSDYQEFGAADTDCKRFLDKVLDDIFGEE